MTILDQWSVKFQPDAEPVASVVSGEIVQFNTVDCFNGQIQSERDTMAHLDESSANPATGPLYVEDAEPGDVIAVDILDIRVADHGVCCTMTDEGPYWPMMELRSKIIPIRKGYAHFNDVKWPIDPMIGVIGTAVADREVPTEWVKEKHSGERARSASLYQDQ